jgi:hypothetical protein
VAIAAEADAMAEGAGKDLLLRKSPQTSPETIALVLEFWERLEFTPRFETEPDSAS